MEDKSSILVSIFKRKGGEGIYTRILDETNRSNYKNALKHLDKDEKALIICFKGDEDWQLLSNKRLINNQANRSFSLLNSNIKAVKFSLVEEAKLNVSDKNDFSHIEIIDKQNKKHLLIVETGKPFQGFFQTLHFLAE